FFFEQLGENGFHYFVRRVAGDGAEPHQQRCSDASTELLLHVSQAMLCQEGACASPSGFTGIQFSLVQTLAIDRLLLISDAGAAFSVAGCASPSVSFFLLFQLLSALSAELFLADLIVRSVRP